MTRRVFGPFRAQPPANNGRLRFYDNAGLQDDYAVLTDVPAAFGVGEFTLELSLQLSTSRSIGTANNQWQTANPARYSSGTWWYDGNFVVDGHNNEAVHNGTLSWQIINGNGATGADIRVTFGDGAPQLTNGSRPGGLHAVQSQGLQLRDGRAHRAKFVRRWDAGTGAILELWVDGELVSTETSTVRTNMRTWWDTWAAFTAGQAGWMFGAEKFSALGGDPWEDFDGDITDMAFFSRAQSAAELQNDYWVTPSVGATGLVGLFRMTPLDGSNRTYDAVRPASFLTCTPRAQGPARVAGGLAITSGLGAAAAALPSNAFVQRPGLGLNATSVNPGTGFSGTVLQDARISNGEAHITGFSGKGSYDTRSRRVTFMGCGYSTGINNNSAGAYVVNCRPVFVEATDTWSTTRAFRAADETTAAEAIGHMYDGNAINVTARRLYKAKKDTNQIYVFDLDARVMLNSIAGPAGVSNSTNWAALEFIPTRGAQGSIWLLQYASGSNAIQLWEYNLATFAWSVIVSAASFGNSTGGNGPTMSYNPRAFGGAGGVMIGNQVNAWTVRADTLALAAVSLPNGRPLDCASSDGSSGFCRDPVGPGFIKFSDTDNVAYRWTGSAWETRASLPGGLTGDYMVIPIDAYGVIMALVWGAGGTSTAFLYKP